MAHENSERWISIEKLTHNTVQPPKRTANPKALAPLVTSLKEYGQLKTIPVAELTDKPGVLMPIDGHRTSAALKISGLDRVRCTVTRMTEAEALVAFTRANATTVKFYGKGYLYQWAASTNRKETLAAMPSGTAANIRKFVALFGEKRAEEYGLSETVDPGVVNVVAHALKAMNNCLCRVPIKQPTPERFGTWLLEQRAQVKVRFIAMYGTSKQLRRLAKCVRENRPFIVKMDGTST